MNVLITENDKVQYNMLNTGTLYKSRKEDKSNYLHGRKPLKIRFYANGDKFFQGKKISLQPNRFRDIEELMAELSSKMPPQVYLPSGIRQLFSPSSGRRITDVNQLESEHEYVCAGNESFKGINYGRNEREPWFRGRPQNLARFAQLLPLGLGVGSTSTGSNTISPSGNSSTVNRPLVDQTNYYNNVSNNNNSLYAKQNAFPTRYHKPIVSNGLSNSTNYLLNSQNRSNQYSNSILYPKLIKVRNKQIPGRAGVNYSTLNSTSTGTSTNYHYQEMLNQQIRPRVITVVRNSSERPKNFVRILLNKRSVQSFETLVGDIETSLKDQSVSKRTENMESVKIDKIFSLLGKEVKSVADFFKNDEFFIAIGEQEYFGEKQVKEILDDMYPNHPQTSQIIQYWASRKPVERSVMKEVSGPVENTATNSSNNSVDKRDSGFEEQDFSKESDYTSQNIDVSTAQPLPKPKISKNKPAISQQTLNRRKRATQRNKFDNSSSLDTDSQYSDGGTTVSTNTITTQRSLQQRNADRLKAAYLEREKYRQTIRAELNNNLHNTDHQHPIDTTTDSATASSLDADTQHQLTNYSQLIKKSVSDKSGSIDVFKKMDQQRESERKHKLRNKQEQKNSEVISSSTSESNLSSENLPNITSSHPNSKSERRLPQVNDADSNINIDNQLDNKDQALSKESVPYEASPKALRKLNKISEVANEEDSEIKLYSAKKNKTKTSKSSFVDSKENKEEIKEHRSEEINESEPNEIKKNEPEEIEPDVPEKQNKQEPVINLSPVVEAKPEMKLKVELPPIEPFDDSRTSPRASIDASKENIKEIITSSTPNKQEAVVEQNSVVRESPKSKPSPLVSKVTNTSSTKALSSTSTPSVVPVAPPVKSLSPELTTAPHELPGTRVMGKLCRQIHAADSVYQRYDTNKLLGDGNFAVVKLALRKTTSNTNNNKSSTSHKEYAMKIIDKSKMRGKESMIENEIWIMKLCNHTNIIRLKEEYETAKEVFLIMELVKGGDLFDAITQSVKFTESIAAKMVIDMSNALFYLHTRKIVHRDLKPENLLVMRHKDGSITLKLADFGLAMEVKKLIYTVCGTPTYVAPEILSERGYSLEVDMWALGVITYILLCGFPPFRSPNRDQDQLFEMIKSGNFNFISPYWDNISFDVKDLIRRLLVVDRKSRFSTMDVLSHRWIMSIGGSKSSSLDMSVERKARVQQLEHQAQTNFEQFQLDKKQLRSSINREIQQAYLTN